MTCDQIEANKKEKKKKKNADSDRVTEIERARKKRNMEVCEYTITGKLQMNYDQIF